MTLRDFAPHLGVAVLFCAFLISDGAATIFVESGFKDILVSQVSPVLQEGKSPWSSGLLLTGIGSIIFNLLGFVFWFVFPLAYGFDHGWRPALGLVLTGLVIYILYTFCLVILNIEKTNSIVGSIATLLALVFIVALVFQVSWFGLRSLTS